MASVDPEMFLQALAAACSGLDGWRVEIDRRMSLDETDLPAAIVRNGPEENDPVDAQLWFRRFVFRPSIELYATGETPSAARATISAAWTQILDAIRTGPIPNMIARNSTIGAQRQPIEPDDNSRFSGALCEFAFTYDR